MPMFRYLTCVNDPLIFVETLVGPALLLSFPYVRARAELMPSHNGLKVCMIERESGGDRQADRQTERARDTDREGERGRKRER